MHGPPTSNTSPPSLATDLRPSRLPPILRPAQLRPPAPGRPTPARPTPDRPASARPAPARPAPGRLTPARPTPDRPASGSRHLPGRPAPRLSGCPTSFCSPAWPACPAFQLPAAQVHRCPSARIPTTGCPDAALPGSLGAQMPEDNGARACLAARLSTLPGCPDAALPSTRPSASPATRTPPCLPGRRLSGLAAAGLRGGPAGWLPAAVGSADPPASVHLHRVHPPHPYSASRRAP